MSKFPRTRKRSVYAQNYDGLVYARVDITVGVRENRLSRDEQSEALESLASHAMQNLSCTRFINAPLSKVKVTR
jgi:hypothetical protein